MKKYGYKNISHMDSFLKSDKNDFKNDPVMTKDEHYGNHNMVDWGKQGDWGVPGQTHYRLKTIDELIKANEFSKDIYN